MAVRVVVLGDSIGITENQTLGITLTGVVFGATGAIGENFNLEVRGLSKDRTPTQMATDIRNAVEVYLNENGVTLVGADTIRILGVF